MRRALPSVWSSFLMTKVVLVVVDSGVCQEKSDHDWRREDDKGRRRGRGQAGGNERGEQTTGPGQRKHEEEKQEVIQHEEEQHKE